MGYKKQVIIGVTLFLLLLTLEFYLQVKFIRNRRYKIKNIHARLSDPEFKKYTESITRTHQIINGQPNIGYALRPNSSAEFNYAPLGGKWTVQINNIGFRHRGDIQTCGYKKKSIVLLGDSVTFGAGVDIEETFAYKLAEKITTADGNYDVLNFAVGGYSIIDNIGNFFYRQGSIFNPACIIFFYTIKSIFDAPRTNDPLTGFHLEKWPGLMSLHLAKKIYYGGKKGILLKYLQDFIDFTEKNNIEFIFMPIPALFNNSLYPGMNTTFLKYTEAVDFQYKCKKKFPNNYMELTSKFVNSDYTRLYRRDSEGNLNNYEVHLNSQGHDFVSNILFQLLRQKNILSCN